MKISIELDSDVEFEWDLLLRYITYHKAIKHSGKVDVPKTGSPFRDDIASREGPDVSTEPITPAVKEPDTPALGEVDTHPDISVEECKQVIAEANAVAPEQAMQAITTLRKDLRIEKVEDMNGTQRSLLVHDMKKLIESAATVDKF